MAGSAAAASALAVDAARGWLFVSAGGTLRRAALDGTNLTVVRSATAIVDIAIDTTVSSHLTFLFFHYYEPEDFS